MKPVFLKYCIKPLEASIQWGFPGLVAFVVFSLSLACLLTGCGKQELQKPPDPELDPAGKREAVSKALPQVKFRDITEKAGIRFQHVNGAFGNKLLPETMGSGVAFLDYDKDGKQDLLFINSCYWPGHGNESTTQPTLKMYHNQGNNKFTDVTSQIGLAHTMFGMGVTAGDYDNDGWVDVFITGMGGCKLFHNESDGKGGRRFVDVTSKSDAFKPRGAWPTSGDILKREQALDFPTSATFFDYDCDGLLDLFVCNYVTWSPTKDQSQHFTLEGKARAYGPPTAFKGSQSQLFHNEGNGIFKDVSLKAGIHVASDLGDAAGKSLGVAIWDVNNDGWPDIVVANDTVRNFFFLNKGDGTFQEKGQEAGVAYADGNARGAMGIDCGEIRPGKHAIVIGNFANEPNTLLRLDDPRRTLFSDVALIEGLAGPSQISLVFGLFYFDYDLDGQLDLLTCNGHLEPEIKLVQPDQKYAQPPQLFWNTHGRRCFEPISEKEAGPDLFQPLVGRGCAFADIDQDGDLDVVLTSNGGSPRLLRNEGGTGHHWIRFQLEGNGKTTNRSAIGARLVITVDGKKYERLVVSGRGYLSQSDLGVTLGLGNATKVERLEIYWPMRGNQTPQVLTNLDVDKVHQIKQGG